MPFAEPELQFFDRSADPQNYNPVRIVTCILFFPDNFRLLGRNLCKRRARGYQE